MKLSIIIPAYNVEKYIERCIYSCCEQKTLVLGKDYEVIVVNDGSKDGTLQILEKIKKQIPELQIVTQENRGLSGARNSGLEIAGGDFVWFVDGDDTIAENCLVGLCEILKPEIDAVQIYANTVVSDKEFVPRAVFEYAGSKTGKELLLENKICCCAPFTIYNRDFLGRNKLRFYEGIFHEDNEFTPRAYFFAEAIICYPHFLYFVTINPNSITRVVNPKRSFDCLVVADSLQKFKVARNISKDVRLNAVFCDHIGQVCSNAFSMILACQNKEFYNRFYLDLSQHRVAFKNMWHSGKAKYKLYSVLMNLISYFPRTATFVFRVWARCSRAIGRDSS